MTNNTIAIGLPPYIKNNNQENYHEELNQTLREWLSPTGFQIPNLTNAQITDLLMIQTPLPGTIWFNTDANPPYGALQLVTLTGVIQTITSA